MDLLTQALGGHIAIYQLIIIVTVVMAVSFVLGIKVQTLTHFIWPKDVCSMLIYLLCIADLVVVRVILDVNLFDLYIWAPFLTAYFLGFFFSSAGCYIFLATPLLAAQRMVIGYIVPYWVGDEQFVQTQRNRELLKRLLLGIEHKIECNTRLESNWEIPVKHPYMPIPKIKALLIDTIIDEDPEILRDGKRITFRQYTTRITVAPGSIRSKMDMIMIEDAHTTDVNENIKLSAELLRTKQTSYRKSMSAAADLLCYATVDATPGMQILDHMQQENDKKSPKKGDKDERGTKQ